jgi:hypothetical protein
MHPPADPAEDDAAARPGRRRLRLGRAPAVVCGGTDVLSGRVRTALDAHTTAGERVEFCLRGDLNHSLIALDERLLIVKPGFHAGSTFGSLVTTIYYCDVTGIQVHTFLLSGWIEISSPSFQGRERKRNRHPRTSDRDVYKLPNCVPIHKRRVPQYRPSLERLRELVAQTKETQTKETQARGGSSVVVELERLEALRTRGTISADEFAAAKELVLAEQSARVQAL